jgi:hypothetical protein
MVMLLTGKGAKHLMVLPESDLLALIPEYVSPGDYAKAMWEAYKEVRRRLVEYRINAYKDSVHKHDNGVFLTELDLSNDCDFDYAYRHMTNASQSLKSLVGTVMNRVTAKFYGDLFSPFKGSVSTELKALITHVSSKRVNIDVKVTLPEFANYISVTTTTRERKKGDWPTEYDLIEKANRGNRQQWEFVGLTYEGSKDEVATLRSELPRGMKVVCVEQVDEHAEYLRTWLSRIQ